MKTSEQIAGEAMSAFTFIDPDLNRDNNDVAEQNYYYIKDQIEAAIEADRAQRSYRATVREDGFSSRTVEVQPGPNETIAEAIIDRGDMRSEWELVNVEAIA